MIEVSKQRFLGILNFLLLKWLEKPYRLPLVLNWVRCSQMYVWSETFDTTFSDTDTILILGRSRFSIPIRYWYYLLLESLIPILILILDSCKIRYWYWYWYFCKKAWYQLWYQFLLENPISLLKINRNCPIYYIFRTLLCGSKV